MPDGRDNAARLSTSDLLKAEARQLRDAQLEFSERDDEAARLRQVADWAVGQDLSALCLSGGGIRSASFAIGLMQALARKGVLPHFDYLSTVSGGGYAGSWITRWIYELTQPDRGVPGASSRAALEEVATRIARSSPDNAQGGEPCPPLQHVRAYSNYLTARLGITSPDLWTSMVLVFRNVLLNQTVFLPMLLAIATLPNLYADGMAWLVQVAREMAGGPERSWIEHLAYLSVALMGFATSIGHNLLPSHDGQGKIDRPWARNWIAIPVCLAAFMLPLWLAPYALPAEPPSYRKLWLMLFAAIAIGGILGELLTLLPTRAGHPTFSLRCAAAGIVGSLFSSGAVTLGAWLWSRLGSAPAQPGMADPAELAHWSRTVLASFGPCWILVCSVLHASVYVAFERVMVPWRAHPGAPPVWRMLNNDRDREWLARLGALKLVPALAWGVLALACLLVPYLVRGSTLTGWSWTEIATVLGTIGSTALTAFGGASPATSGEATPTAKKGFSERLFGIAVLVATALSLLGVFTLLSWLEQWMAVRILTNVLGPTWDTADRLAFDAGLIGVLVAISGLTSGEINVNRFSLHAVYRNRLMRAFLGAGRRFRRPDRFTGFDIADNVRLHRLRGEDGVPRRLYPVVNACLNATQGDNLAWQERKAAPFVLTPIACGSAELERLRSEPERRKATRPHKGAYVDSAIYGGNEVDEPDGDMGVSLATAITISGAAFNPASGYHTSPITAFFMTLFNVRLGSWLPNPARGDRQLWERAGPRFALTPLWQEMTGNIGMRGDYLHLSDGGHFENLGLYEMVRRRCRCIVVSDAGADPRCALDDLGNAVRKIRIDLNVEITFRRLDLASRETWKTNSLPIAIGTIRYPDSPMEGILVYIKASYADDTTHPFFDRLPVDVREYANRRREFPHESTADQWFSESQFESYRRLGEYIGMQLGDRDSYDSATAFVTDVRRRYLPMGA